MLIGPYSVWNLQNERKCLVGEVSWTRLWNLRHSSGAVVRFLICGTYVVDNGDNWELLERALKWETRQDPVSFLHSTKKIVHMLNVTFMNVGHFVLTCKYCRYAELLVWPKHFKPRIYLSAVHLKPTICWKSSWSTDGAGSQEASTASRF